MQAYKRPTYRFTIARCFIALAIFHLPLQPVCGENGYECWLRYKKVENPILLRTYQAAITGVNCPGNSASLRAARQELELGLSGLLGRAVQVEKGEASKASLVIRVGWPRDLPHAGAAELGKAGEEGFLIISDRLQQPERIYIIANRDAGVLYGVFHFLRLLQTSQPLAALHILSAPRLRLRLLNHWDNLNRTVERGYAGASIWNWHTLPGYIDQRYIDYARLNASVGINGAVLNNVNANALILTAPYLEKVRALADVFRPYGIKVYLSARFSAPAEIGGLSTADPLASAVQQWWRAKAAEIYALIPDFGGFLVKANSEGQPGPQTYGRSHAEGADMLAEALAPHGGVVIWRAFVYSNETPGDRHKQAFEEFVPLDGKFRDNVMVQVKNGPIDFMPREPFHPLFGAMPKTALMTEFQLTQEYLGQGTHLVYLAPLFKECLESDTYCMGKGSTVAKVIDGSLYDHRLTGMTGVSNIGSDLDWTGHPFGQANWYALGRLAWDHRLPASVIAEEWLRMSFTNDAAFVQDLKNIMLSSRETLVRYMNPLGLHHLMGTGHHYGPAPWVDNLQRADWNPVYYHRADALGLGFDRTSTGSNALAQYAEEVRTRWEHPDTCPESLLLWFHHVPWNYRLRSGRSLWNELCYQYAAGVDSVRLMQKVWARQASRIDEQRFNQVTMLLQIQEQEATWWRDACLLYFQTFSHMPFPPGYEQPAHGLAYYKALRFPLAPGNGQ